MSLIAYEKVVYFSKHKQKSTTKRSALQASRPQKKSSGKVSVCLLGFSGTEL